MEKTNINTAMTNAPKLNKVDLMYQRIEKHGSRLNEIFHTGINNIELCKKLRSIETKMHEATTKSCNGTISDEEYEIIESKTLMNLDKLLNYKKQNVPVFINGDCRGYALKIDDSFHFPNDLYKDWGGYGIIAPDFNDKQY